MPRISLDELDVAEKQRLAKIIDLHLKERSFFFQKRRLAHQLVKDGVSARLVAEEAGISHVTVMNWYRAVEEEIKGKIE